MRNILIILALSLLAITLGSCEQTEEPLVITAESEISMENLDLYLFRDDVQYIDLRNFESSFKYGIIEGFDVIPFFDYLDFRAFNRDRTYEFDPDQILDERILLRLFEPEKAIFLYADGCIRSGYLKDVLNYLGYERVFVIGGYYEYLGEHVIGGSGHYNIGNTFYDTYIDETNDLTYVMYGDFDVANNITYIRFDILNDENISVRYDVEMNMDSTLTIVENFLTDEIYNFNEVYEDIYDHDTLLYLLLGSEWNSLESLVALLELEYID
ncbi:hypothetical protein KQ51_00789 [Candidatus Izimaplasma bacterium HR1]|jgi:rhodanese-related sulfurtransferase|uniref:hypothetical protein n=1 Tax=Candidatus Izimoplasma sp. HR1 TaxID=1541959 RepID=UPI0004F7D5A3|nr:hypothetical protein KQ51_00789 [Candidatus Izimaplasma bacterium HR1]